MAIRPPSEEGSIKGALISALFLSFIFNNPAFKFAGFIAEFFMISGWVFIWEMVETISITRSELISKRLNKLQLYDAEIRFIFDD